MFYIKSLPPKNPVSTWTYNRFGEVIPEEEIQVESLKEFFSNSPLSEEKLEKALREDQRVIIENDNDREARLNREKEEIESTDKAKLEKKTKEYHKKDKLNKKIEDFNERKEKALETEIKEDDIQIEKEEKELEKEIKEVNDGTK